MTAGGVQIGHRRYWHESFATRIGLKIMIHVDERTIQEVYPQIDEKLVAARVVGSFPHVTKVEWDAAAAALRNRGRAFQQSGGQTEIARLVHANRQEVQGATNARAFHTVPDRRLKGFRKNERSGCLSRNWGR